MAVAITFSELARRARQVGGAGLLPYPLPQGVGRVMSQILVSSTRRRFQTATGPDGTPWAPLKFPRIRGGSSPLLDTGILRNSISGRAEPYGASVGTVVPYSALHQFGGTITPKNGKRWLTLPLTLEAMRAGSVARLEALLRKRLFRPGGRVSPKKVLCETRGGRLVAHFALKESVAVPARPFLGVGAIELAQFEQLASELAAGNLTALLGGP